jgi:hypothetical protein
MPDPTPIRPPAPTPSPPPPDAPADSSTDSAPASSTSRRAAGLFIDDPGPAFDSKQAAAEPAPEPPAPELAAGVVDVGWEEDTVRSLLSAEGQVVHSLAGVADDDWLWLSHELDAIAPPLTRILNRYPALRAAAEAGDGMAVMIALGGHVTRSYMTRRAELVAAAAEAPAEPVTGVRAPEGTGPPPPEEAITWQT